MDTHIERFRWLFKDLLSSKTTLSGTTAITGTTTIGTGATLTTPVVNGPTGTQSVETLITTRVLTSADSGKTFFLDLVGGFTVSLPAVASSAGFTARFFVKTAPTTAYIVQTNASEQKLAGLILCGAGTDEDSEVAFTGTNIDFVANTAVINDSAEVFCDGVGWYARCFCNATGGITITG